ncbi:solute carrier family 66 member 3 [Folsomia candida]|uniref:PQ-loop repeat-containing protein 3 n=1 Tax=Folsomia candida TaxID=158441 RepID=A0A226F5K7_FOLCA|nr:solute carrier family 66 member 3 [Folsomia candida]OXA64630.1 PQ-loop repeat-containing protein 3 [Folsomia candida]
MDFKEWIIPFLDLTTIGLCIVCKLPQIVAILKSKSSIGLSVNSVMVELFGYSIVLGYNWVQGYPISSFMEYFFLVSGDIVLIFVIFYYMGTLDVMKVGGAGVYITVLVGFTQGVPHPQILPVLMKFATPCSASSKILQLKEMWRIGNSDSVSTLTWLIAAYTCVTRIVTNLMLTGDLPLLINYGVALTLNVGIILSALYLRKNPATAINPLKSQDDVGSSQSSSKLK